MMKPIVLILMFVLSFFSFSQIEMPEDKVDWDFSVEQNGCDATIIGKLKIQEGWHIYALDLPEGSFSIPTTFKVDRKSTRLNSSHVRISYAVFCLKKKKK